jgi:hypothetical protein
MSNTKGSGFALLDLIVKSTYIYQHERDQNHPRYSPDKNQ